MNKEEKKAKNKKYREDNREALRIKSRKYYKENKEARSAYQKNYNKVNKEYRKKYDEDNKEVIKNRVLKRKYGITLEDYNNMLENQNYVCSICKKPETKLHYKSNKLRSLVVDHCHETGKVRGLLCAKCNLGLGSFLDNVMNLIKAAKYLIFHRKVVDKIVKK